MELKKPQTEKLEGIDAATSTADDVQEEQRVELNNNTVPTTEEEENANIVSDTSIPTPEAEDIVEETQSEPELEPEEEQELGQESSINPELGIAEGSATETTFTQSQVDEIAGKVRKETREKVTKDFFSRYGVNSADELDDLFGNAQRFDTLQDTYNGDKKAWSEADAARNQEIAELRESVALLSSGIDKNRYEDAKFILKGKGLEVTPENIEAELATHPEWKANLEVGNDLEQELPFRKKMGGGEDLQPQGPATNISVLGNTSTEEPTPELTDYEKAMKMFKV